MNKSLIMSNLHFIVPNTAKKNCEFLSNHFWTNQRFWANCLSESFSDYLTLHRQQHNWNVPRSRNLVNTSVKQSKNNNLLNHSSPPSYVVCHFREHHNAYARFLLSVNNDTQITFMLALSPECKQRGVCQMRSWVISKMADDVTRGRKKLICFLCAKKGILVASQNWSWATDVTWTVLPMYLLHFWTWEHFSCVAVYGGSDRSPISSKTS